MAKFESPQKLIHTRISVYLAALWLITLMQNVYELKTAGTPPAFLELFIAGLFYFYLHSGKKFARGIFVYTTVLDVISALIMLFLTFRPAPTMAFSLWKFGPLMRMLFWIFTALKIIISYHLIFNQSLKSTLDEKYKERPNLIDKPTLLAAGLISFILIIFHLLIKVFYYY